jgi:hypothetical protein
MQLSRFAAPQELPPCDDPLRRRGLQVLRSGFRVLYDEVDAGRYPPDVVWVGLQLNRLAAPGDAEPDSDIDVLVVLKGAVSPGQEVERTGDIVSDVSLLNRAVVSCVFVSDERFRSEWTPLLANVRRDGVPA